MLSKKEFESLEQSIEWSEKQLEFSRDKYRAGLALSVGYHYSDNGTPKLTPVNFIRLIERIYTRLLAPQAPRALISCRQQHLRPTAKTMEHVLMDIVKQINFDQTLRQWVHEAMYSPWGVLKVGLYPAQEVLGYNYGKIFADIVPWDDYFCDLSAKYEKQMQYEGNDYWMGYEDFMESDWFEKKKGDNIRDDDYTLVSNTGGDTAQSIGIDTGNATLYKKKIHLRDVWLPDERVLLTYGVTSHKIFKQVEFDDEMPASGPYPKLGYDLVGGGHLLPLPPVALWRDLHEANNALLRKIITAAEGQKNVLGFDTQEDEDIIAFRNAVDGAGIRYQGRPPEVLQAGGADQRTIAVSIMLKQLQSWSAGNIDTLGGLSPMSETVGQEKLLSESSNAMLKDMFTQTVDAIRNVYHMFLTYEWNDPLANRQLEEKEPMTGISVPVRWDGSMKQGKLSDYNIDIDIFSHQDNTPSTRLQKIQMFLQGIVGPMMPFLQQNNATVDAKVVIEEAVRCMGYHELDSIVQFIDGQPGEGQQQGQPQNTTRQYDRVSSRGGTQRGQDNALVNQLLGGGQQGMTGQE